MIGRRFLVRLGLNLLVVLALFDVCVFAMIEAGQ